MKNQYFADINDYRKYGLLRLLSNEGAINTAVCWMLTAGDNRTDGKFTDYVQQPERWRSFDSVLFDSMALCLKESPNRNVVWAETDSILPSATYWPALLTDDRDQRKHYFAGFLEQAHGADLVFFDPDNGLEVKSVPCGRRNSCKYLYWNELKMTFCNGHSVLVYQHFKRIKRDIFLNDLSREIRQQTRVPAVMSYSTANVVFFLIPQARHLEDFRQQSQQVANRWQGQIAVNYHD